jgi:hypothetical protein
VAVLQVVVLPVKLITAVTAVILKLGAIEQVHIVQSQQYTVVLQHIQCRY